MLRKPNCPLRDSSDAPAARCRDRGRRYAIGRLDAALRLFPLLFLLLGLAPGVSAANPARADSLYRAGAMREAATLYETLTREEPGNGRHWYRLGMARAALGDHRGALVALTKSESIGRNPVVMYNLACSHARLGETGPAFDWLHRALAAGFAQAGQIEGDEDLKSLHSDSRWAAFVAEVRKASRPCASRAESRQFDFWIGDWEVKDAAGNFAGTNSILPLLGDCVLNENWTDGSGNSGKSYNFYNSVTGHWQQTWVDDKGGVQEYVGDFVNGEMRFRRESRDAQGRAVQHRLTFSQLGPDHVRQFAERSADSGATWSVDYDLHYFRKAAAR